MVAKKTLLLFWLGLLWMSLSSILFAQIAHFPLDSSLANTSVNGLPNTHWETYNTSYSYGYLGERDESGGLYFYGSTDTSYAQLQTALPTREVSLSLWFKTSDPSGGTLLSWNRLGYGIRLNQGGRLYTYLYVADNTYYDFVYDQQNLADNAWHHVVLTYNTKTFKVAVDGVVVYENDEYGSDRPVAYDPDGELYLGGVPGLLDRPFYIGSIDEIMLYNRAVSVEEIKLLYHRAQPGKGDPVERGQLVYFPFYNDDLNHSTNHTDAMKFSAQGGRFTTSCTPGAENDRAKFLEGSGSCLSVNKVIQLTEQFSLCLNISTNDGRERFLAGWEAGGYQLWLNPPGAPGKLAARIWVNADSIHTLVATRNVNDGSCHHIALIFDGSTAALYLDGQRVASESFPAPKQEIFYRSERLLVGHATERGFQGTVDEFRLYNRVLTSKEVARLAGNAEKGADSASTDTSLSTQRYVLGGSKRNGIAPCLGLMVRNHGQKSSKCILHAGGESIDELKLKPGESTQLIVLDAETARSEIVVSDK